MNPLTRLPRYLSSRRSTTARCLATPFALGSLLLLPAAATTWTGAGGNDNWSTAGNWDAGLPAGTDAVFGDLDGTGTKGPSGTPNNIVDANTTVSTLKYTNLEATTGNHTTQIPAGVTLDATGGGTCLSVNSPTTGASDVVYATILGDGSLALNNSAANLYVGQGSATANATRRATLDMAGLATFQATLNRLIVGQQSVSNNRSNGTIQLAKTNTIDLAYTAASAILLGEMTSNNGNSQILELGTANTILCDSGMTVGGRKGNGILRYNAAAVAAGSGTATFRNRAGTGRQANWFIGDNSAQAGGGTFSVGEVDFSVHGAVDAQVGTITLGRATAAGTGVTTTTYTQGTLTFDSGTIDTNALTAGIQPNSGSGNARGTVNVDGTGKLVVNADATLGRYLGGTYTAEGLVNIGTVSGGGQVAVTGNIVCGGGSGNKIAVANGGKLAVTGILGAPGDGSNPPLETLDLNACTLQFDLGSAGSLAGTRAFVKDLTTTGTVNLVILGKNFTANSRIELIKYTGTLGGAGFPAFQLTLPNRVEGTLEHNATNQTIDLVISAVSGIKWAGTPNGDWDIDTTANWTAVPAGTPAKYIQSSIPGDAVLFDETATGTRTVNLTTVLSPASILVSGGQNYSFGGSGALSGTADLVKQGSGTLVIDNTGSNDFTGAVAVSGGTLRLGGSDDRLPVNAPLQMADAADVLLDLNGLSQTVGSLNGGGSAGGNIQLGAGTLTVAGPGTYGGTISGSGSFRKSGTGTLLLTAAHTFAGGTTVSGGRLNVANPGGDGLGSGPVQIDLGATLGIGNADASGSLATGTITNNGTVVYNRSDDIDALNPIEGTGGVTKNGDGMLTVGIANTYSGTTTVNGGAVVISDPDALGDTAGNTVVNNGATANLQLSGGITLNEPLQLAQKQSAAGNVPCLVNVDGENTLAGPVNLTTGGSFWTLRSDTGKLTITGTMTNIATTNTRVLRLFGEALGEIQSNLADGAGTSITAVTKDEGGTWILAGTNTNTGATTVDGGLLLINGSHTASPVTVNFFGALGGTGTLGSLTAAGTVAPGGTETANAVGTLRAGNTKLYITVVDITSPGTLKIDIDGGNADRLSVTGTLDITGANLEVNELAGGVTQTSYVIAEASVAPIVGTFANVPAGYTVAYNQGPQQNQIVLSKEGVVDPYLAWLAAYPALTGANRAPDIDFDKDGLPNGIEYVIGGDPTVPSQAGAPVASRNGDDLILTFKRSDASEGTAVYVETGTDLQSFPGQILIPVGPVTGPPVTVVDNGPTTPDDVTVFIPRGSDPAKFARLKVTIPFAP